MVGISSVLGFLKSGAGKGLAIALVVLSIGAYIYVLNGKLDSAIEDKKYAENNVLLVTAEFDRLYDLQTELEADVAKQEKDHAYEIGILKLRHKQELIRTTELAKINEGIKNVKEEDDGPVANVLNDTLDALRVYK